MSGAIQSRIEALRWLIRTVGVLIGMVLIWLALSVGIAASFVETNPVLAARWSPHDPRALSALAEHKLGPTPAPATSAEIERLVVAAIRRDPTLSSAARTLGLVVDMQGNHSRALRLMMYAQALSRRDFPTQLWLSQEAIGHDDVPGVLHHYDVALRTSAASQAVVMPVLISATHDTRLIEPLANVLVHADAWRDDFLTLSIQGASSARNLVKLAQALARRGVPLSDAHRAALLTRLVAEEDFAPARILYAAVQPKRAAAQDDIVDGGFDKTPRFPPFDWELADQADLHAERVDAVVGRGMMLSFVGENGMGGIAARRLLMLPPGHYRFSARAGNISASSPIGRPRWQIRCAPVDSGTIFNLVFPVAGDAGRHFTADLHIPDAKCAAQWLSLRIPGDSNMGSPEPAWVDSVAIIPIG